MNTEKKLNAVSPAGLPPELGGRFLSAMLAASRQPDADAQLERRLRRLRPTRLSATRQTRLRRVMETQQLQPVHVLRYGWRYLCRWAGAAAVLALLGTAAVLMIPGNAAASIEPAGFAGRSILLSEAGDDVQWRDGQVPVRPVEVLYEDSLILEDEENTTFEVRVSNRTTVLIEDEVI